MLNWTTRQRATHSQKTPTSLEASTQLSTEKKKGTQRSLNTEQQRVRTLKQKHLRKCITSDSTYSFPYPPDLSIPLEASRSATASISFSSSKMPGSD